MGKAVIHVSPKMLTKILLLPEGYTVSSVHARASNDGLSFIISSDSIPEVEEGQEYPLAVPTYQIDETRRVSVAEVKVFDK